MYRLYEKVVQYLYNLNNNWKKLQLIFYIRRKLFESLLRTALAPWEAGQGTDSSGALFGLTFCCPHPECVAFACCDVYVGCQACYFTQKLLNCLKQSRGGGYWPLTPPSSLPPRRNCGKERGVRATYVHGCYCFRAINIKAGVKRNMWCEML